MKILGNYFIGSHKIRLLICTLTALVVADGLISKFIVEHGFAREGNPLLQIWVGENTFLALKLLGAILIAIILWDIYKQNPKLSYISTVLFVISYTAIVFWNLYAFFITQM
ncbi:DUF5658 family protein [Chloroflexota bacterium]